MAKIAPLTRLLGNITRFNATPLGQIRNSGFYSSPFLEDLGIAKTKYEVCKNPQEWAYVERALPPKLVPDPVPKSEYPSGWKPAADDFKGRPYYVQRTKNHMMPVYLRIRDRGVVRCTEIRKIQGDIWMLSKELREFIQDMIKPRFVRMQVNEFAGKIIINGDFVNAVKWWLGERNF